MQAKVKKRIAQLIVISLVVNVIETVAAPNYGIAAKITRARAEYANCVCKGFKKHVSLTTRNEFELDIAATLCAIVERAQEQSLGFIIPEKVMSAYIAIKKNTPYIHEDEFEALLPLLEDEILHMLFDKEDEANITRATANSGTVLYNMLNALSTQISQAGTEQHDHSLALTQNFSQTWTILQNNTNLITKDFSYTWTMIQNERNVLHKDFTQTWTMVQSERNLLHKDFTQSWTMIQSGNTAQQNNFNTLQRDFTQSWTMIQNNTNVMIKDFNQTWTVLNRLDRSFRQTWTVVQTSFNTLHKDFTQTWTIIGASGERVANPTGTFNLCTASGTKTLSTSVDLPDFNYSGVGGACSSLTVNKTTAFDAIDNYNASAMRWLKMIYILVRNINNELRGSAAVGTATTGIPTL
jgi:hypothetical protein